MALTDTLTDPSDQSRLYGWDWSATTHDMSGDAEGFLEMMAESLGSYYSVPGKGLQGWSRSLATYDRDGFRLGTLYFGGGREDVHVVSTGGAADQSRGRLLGHDPAGRTSRVDTRVDTLVPFDELGALCEAAADSYGSRIIRMESSERGVSMGRTIYLGAPSSAVRVRIYEKWLESPGQYVEGTNRVEVQLRPASKAKARVSAWGPAETFCASRVTRHLAELLGDDAAPAASLHIDRGTPELERTLQVMGEQYGGAVARWLELSGGDLGKVLDHLGVNES